MFPGQETSLQAESCRYSHSAFSSYKAWWRVWTGLTVSCKRACVCGARARKHGHKIRGTLKKETKMGIKRGKVPASGWWSVKGTERGRAEQSQGCSRRLRLSPRTCHPHTALWTHHKLSLQWHSTQVSLLSYDRSRETELQLTCLRGQWAVLIWICIAGLECSAHLCWPHPAPLWMKAFLHMPQVSVHTGGQAGAGLLS